jgi:hypothetical protein
VATLLASSSVKYIEDITMGIKPPTTPSALGTSTLGTSPLSLSSLGSNWTLV